MIVRHSLQYDRLPIFGAKFAIATSHPIASSVGSSVLERGGNAIDAALAAHAVLCVCEPGMTGVGGDCFALYYDASKGKVTAINGSGHAPYLLPAELHEADLLPESANAVTVPGAVAAWCRLSEDFGTRSLEELFAPAIRLAREGSPVHVRAAWDWAAEADRLARDPVAREVLLVDGKAPRAGTLHSQPALADTLAAIAKHGRAAFYEGALAEDIVSILRSRGGAHSLDDFASYRAEYVDPIETHFAGHRIVECPPNGQGVIALLLLNIFDKCLDGRGHVTETDYIHYLAEATKVAYEIRDQVLADRQFMAEDVSSLLGSARARVLAEKIGPVALSGVGASTEHGNNTTYLCAIDAAGNCVSFINSLYDAFGSCIVAPKSGVLLNNRGMCFNTIPDHANRIGPGKKPLHTIIPGMIVTESGRAVGPFGVMGGHYQATGHVDFLRRLLLQQLDPQSAINAPRTFATEGVLRTEPTLDAQIFADLQTKGHRMQIWPRPIGGGQAIVIQRSGILAAGSDPRKDGCAIAQ